MDFEQFADSVNQWMGVPTRDADILGTIDYLAHFVPAFDARPTADALPSEVVHGLSNDSDLRQRLDLDEAARELPNHVSLPPGRALELFETVCRIIDDALVGEQRVHFRRNLPEKLLETFERATPVGPRAPQHPNELASGRPGGSAPLSEGNPAQADSVARDSEPHHDTKLSQSTGMTQERKHRTLAEGEPGSSRSLEKGH